eukprot:sb/3477491/
MPFYKRHPELLHYVFIMLCFPALLFHIVTAKRIKAYLWYSNLTTYLQLPSHTRLDPQDDIVYVTRGGAPTCFYTKMSFSNPNPAMPFCKAKRHPGGCLRHPPGHVEF